MLGILFEQMNVSFLVGWAFSVAASANLPSLVMLLFWKGTTQQGITAAILVGMICVAGLDSAERRHVQGRLRPAGRQRAGAVQPARHRDDPAGLRDAGRGVAVDQKDGACNSRPSSGHATTNKCVGRRSKSPAVRWIWPPERL